MLKSGSRTGIRLLGLMLAALIVGSCINDNLPSAPETEVPLPAGGSFALDCQANVSTERLSCRPQGNSSPQLSEGSAAVIFGGQDLFVRLASSNVTVVGDTFAADVTIENLIPQPMGTPDNSVVTDVNIFFHTGPTNGVTVQNANGTATFTAAGQPFHAYEPSVHFLGGSNNTLEPGETSAVKNWEFDVSAISGSTFQFTVLVSADVPFPSGWVELDQELGTVEAGGTATLAATVKDVVGRTVAGRTLTWTSLDPTVFTVGASTGLATAVGGNDKTGTVLIASDGPEATDTASVKIYELLSARTPVTTAAVTDGERLYKFTVPGGGSSIVSRVGPIASNIRSNGMGARRAGSGDPAPADGRFTLAAAPIVQSVLGVSVDSTATTSAGDADLYVRFGAPPTTDVAGPWDCRSVTSNSRESCTFDDPAPGDWFITIDTFSGFTDAEVNADFAATTAGFDIELVFLDSGLSAEQQLAVSNAAARWGSLITGDLRPFAVMLGNCGGQRINLATDDLYVSVITASQDGPSGTLAFAGPCFVRGTGVENPLLPIVGSTTIDSDDLPGIFADTATLGLVVVHELGHVFGFGTLWGSSLFDFLNGGGTANPTFDGPLAIAAYESVGGPAATEVPVEGQPAGPGTRDVHWRESVFDTELMTGFLDAGTNELSLVTVQSLADEGYTVDTTAVDAYTLPGASIVLEGEEVRPGIPLGNDIMQGPIYAVELNGEFVRVK